MTPTLNDLLAIVSLFLGLFFPTQLIMVAGSIEDEGGGVKGQLASSVDDNMSD